MPAAEQKEEIGDNAKALIEYDEITGALEADLRLYEKSTDGDDWLAEWVLSKIARFKDARELIKKRRKEMIDHIDAEERALFYKWGKPFKDQIDERINLQGGKKKSVNFLTGRAGYRKAKGSISIENNQAAIDWAVDNLSSADLKIAIAGLNKTPLVESVTLAEKVDEETGEIYNEVGGVPDGCIYYPVCEKFYPSPPTKKFLSASESKSLIEGE